MKLLFLYAAILAAFPFYISSSAAETQSCKTETIIAVADVSTSQGSTYRVETYYRTPLENAARFITEQPTMMSVEGPFVWTSNANGAVLGGENERRFVIGHQFHALALSFDAIMTNITTTDDIIFNGVAHHGFTGDYPSGGGAALIVDEEERPLGLIMGLPGETPIEVAYDDWRETGTGKAAPYAVTITHNANVYSYKYREIIFGEGGRKDFHDRFPAPPLDEIAEFRATQIECGEQDRDLGEN